MPDIETTLSDSILVSIKKLLGITQEYTHFDMDVIIHVNTAFAYLFQMGVGPQDNAFKIAGETETWADFLGDHYDLNMVVSQVYIRVKLMFDPPSSTNVTQALQATLAELDWRANIAGEENNR